MPDKKTPVVNVAGADRETIISIILGAIVVIIIGALAFRYFRGNNQGAQPTPTPEGQEQQIVEIQDLPQGEVETESTEEGQIPTNLPARYTVKAGDSTWGIAEAFYGSGFNYVDIEQANDLEPEQGLTPGMVLTIPRVPVRSADTAGAPRQVESENGEIPVNQPNGPTKGDDSAAQEALTE